MDLLNYVLYQWFNLAFFYSVKIKLRISMGIINKECSPIKILIEAQPFMLMQAKGAMDAADRDISRANTVREALL